MQNINRGIDKKDRKKEDEGGKTYTDGYIVSVVFLGNTKPYYFHTYDDKIIEQQAVVVETIHGIELGIVSKGSTPLSKFREGLLLRPVLRVATDQDMRDYQNNIEKAKDAFLLADDTIAQMKLEMRLLQADYTLDGSKITIIYSSDNRVDFRELLKELAGKLHCRIELRQIGSRDRSKIVGGLGVCGLPLCCNTFLGDFDAISINIAKNQFLVLNIQKLSGHCGKLLCCLKYEDKDYTELRQGLPKIGQRLTYDGLQYRISSINVLTQTARIENKEDVKEISLAELVKITPKPEPKTEATESKTKEGQ